MKYNAEIEVEGDSNLILKTFEPESKQIGVDRSQYSVETTENGVRFTIKAKDSVAMRAVLNSISKTLNIIEKSEEIK